MKESLIVSEKRKGIAVILSIGIFFAVFLSTHEDVYAAEYYLGIAKETQQQSNWCWAACVSMINTYYVYLGYPTPITNKTQSQIVTYVKGSPVNASATINQVLSALTFASNRPAWSAGGAVPMSSIITLTDSARPSILGLVPYSGSSGHMVLCDGYNTSGSKMRVVDPAPSGLTIFRYHNDLLQGRDYNPIIGYWNVTLYTS